MATGTGSKIGAVIGYVVLAATFTAVGWISCGLLANYYKGKAMAMAMRPQMGPQTVAIDEVKLATYNLPQKYIAHAEAMQEVNLMTQVDGYVKEIKFKEGDVVKAGQLLYVIDDSRYQAIVNQRKADLAAAEAEERRAKRYYERAKTADDRGITQLERDNAEADVDKSEAVVLQAKANLVAAEYDLGKTKVYAPISGQIGKSNAHIGDYIAPSKGALAKIVQVDPIRVGFPMTDRDYITWRQAISGGSLAPQRVRIMLPDGSEYPHEGQWDFDDNEMSVETATITMRLSFPNADRLLVPNAYVTVLCDLKNPPKYPTVPQTAVFDLPGGNVGVYVLKDDNTVVATAVETLPAHDGFVPVKKGLQAGQKIVVAGTRKLASGMKVTAVKATSTPENDPNYKPTSF